MQTSNDVETKITLFENLLKWKPKYITVSAYQIWNVHKTGCEKCEKVVTGGMIGSNKRVLIVSDREWHYHDKLGTMFTGEIMNSSKRWDQKLSINEYIEANREELSSKLDEKNTLEDLVWKAGIKGPNSFRPTIVIAIARLFWKDQVSRVRVLDPCGGWGDRMIGAAAAGVASYTCYEINNKLIDPYEPLVQFVKKMRPDIKIDTRWEPFETADLECGSFDLIITSPPFADLEVYDGVGWQYESIDDWREEFLYPFLENCCVALAKKGYLVLNFNCIVKEQPIDLTCGLLEYMEFACQDHNMKFMGVLPFAKKKRGKIRSEEDKLISPQPLFIWFKN